jgi:hypothetical protein
MAASGEKVEEKASRELDEKIKAGKSREEIEKEMSIHNVAYKLKDETDE